MPIRIYALAKELDIDSKELVEVCNKAGVTGKGSALASLTDDEIEKIKSHLSAASAPVAAAKRAISDGTVRMGAISRDDYITPGGAGGKPPVVTPAKPQGNAGDKKKSDAPKLPTAKKEPVVKLAAIPQTTPPPAAAAVAKEQTQKPIMTLPPDAISRAKAGGRAPLEQFTKHQDKKRQERAEPTVKRRPGDRRPTTRKPVTTIEPPLPAGKGGKDRRGKQSTTAMHDNKVEGEGKKKLAGMASARATRQQNRRRNQRVRPDDDDDGRRRTRRRLTRRGGTNTALPRKGKVAIELPCTVRSLSEASGVPTAEIQRALMALGTMATINAEIDQEMAELLATDLGMEVEFKQPASLEASLLARFAEITDDLESLTIRPPIITFLGHVDHGKTSLLDRIIGIDVVSGEAGGITQHIRAYKLEKDDRELSFVDTPGHEAFTEMRARGANVTDIAVLVVAADDGVMPQTEEAISHARAAGVPIVVALNKTDLPGADVNKALQELSTHGLLPTEWGGDVDVVKTSALTGDGIDELLETLMLTAEIHEYRANPARAANGICLEAQQEGDRGVLAKMIIKNGTLKVGDVLVCGGAYGKVKAMYHTLQTSRNIEKAGPSTPVSLTGLNVAPEAGDPFYVLDDVAQAREIAEIRQDQSRARTLSGKTVRVSFEEFQRRLEEGHLGDTDEVVTLNIILRADVRGSIEALLKELEKLEHPEVKINVLQATVGGVTSADVALADASDAVIVGFNVIPDEAARGLLEQRGVEFRRYDIIYKVTEDLKSLLEGKLRPEERIADLGRALVQRLFSISRVGTIAGCRVLAGKIERGCRVRVNRDGRGIGDYALDSIRREKDDAKEVREGFECGMKLAGFNDLKEGDILEAYKIEEVARTL